MLAAVPRDHKSSAIVNAFPSLKKFLHASTYRVQLGNNRNYIPCRPSVCTTLHQVDIGVTKEILYLEAAFSSHWKIPQRVDWMPSATVQHHNAW